MEVGASKKGSSICAQCFYTLRGSFPSAKLADMKDAMENHASVSEKCLVFSIVQIVHAVFFQLAYVAAFLRCFLEVPTLVMTHDTKTHDTMINDAFNAFILPEGEGRSPNAFQ